MSDATGSVNHVSTRARRARVQWFSVLSLSSRISDNRRARCVDPPLGRGLAWPAPAKDPR
jgi:hypothetical protein